MPRVPPILPPVFGTPPISPRGLPPFVTPPIVSFPPGSVETEGAMPAATMGEFPAGPFCFGIDKAVCEYLPEKLHVGPTSGLMRGVGFDIPLWGACGVLLNTTCGVLMAIILLTILGIAVAGLVQ